MECKQQFLSVNGVKTKLIVDTAGEYAQRAKGLLGCEGLPLEHGLLIKPCNSVHTIGMKFSIDVIYLSKSLEIVKIRENLKPWRMSGCLYSRSVIEVIAGGAAHHGMYVGARVELIQL